MWSGELDPSAVEKLPLGGEYDVEIENASFKWDLEGERPTLKDVNVKVPHGAFVAIVGMVGSGKSAVLSAVLGEMPKLSGTVSHIPLSLKSWLNDSFWMMVWTAFFRGLNARHLFILMFEYLIG